MRSEFLLHSWKRYPEAPKPNALGLSEVLWNFARVEHIDSSEMGLEGALISRQNVTLQISKFKQIGLGPLRESEDSLRVLPAEHLRLLLKAGDLLAFRETKEFELQIWLLAPSQAPALFKNKPQEKLLAWNQFRQEVRDFFLTQNFVEAQTPSLVVCPGTEPYLEPFSTEYRQGRNRKTWTLPTSPELHLKKLLAADMGPLFEIKTCFRNGEVTPHHHFEFTMLEWYRPFANLDEIAADLQNLVTKVFALRAEAESFSTHFEVKTMRQVFRDYLNVDLKPDSSIDEYRSWAAKAQIETSPTDSHSDLFHRLFSFAIEPRLPKKIPFLIRDFPPFQAAYSRLTEEGWADRFELYWQGLELANAFHELNDPEVQNQRMKQDLEHRKHLQKSELQLDADFLQSLNYGMPPSGGIALGMDRLFMIWQNLEKIQDVHPFTELQIKSLNLD